MADKNYFLVSATYGGKSRVTPISKTDSSGTICNTIKVTYGSTSKYFGATTKTLSCANKYMTGDIEIGLGSTSASTQIELGCKGYAMSTDVVIDIRETSGSNYDIITETQFWTVPAGVTTINVCCVGGGGGGGGSREFSGAGTSNGSWGGGGGYVVTGSFSNLTSGEQFLCTIGKGGTGGSSWSDTSKYANGCGDSGEDTTMKRINTSVTITAKGGGGGGWSSASSAYAGSGGTGGGGGGTKIVSIVSESWGYIYQSGADGGTEKIIYASSSDSSAVRCPSNSKCGYSTVTAKYSSVLKSYYPAMSGQCGEGQSATTLFNGVYYGHGGGGGSKGYYSSSTTKSWISEGGTAYCGGGSGGNMVMSTSGTAGTSGTANTGGGGGGGGGCTGGYQPGGAGGAGGSGVIIITW